MKLILEFNLPEERAEFEDAYDGTDAIIALQEIGNALRKYKHITLDEKQEKLLEEIRTAFYEVVNEYLPGRDF